MEIQEKTLIFDPGGFIIKVIVTVVFIIYCLKSGFADMDTWTFSETVSSFVNLLVYTLLIYDLCSAFGFSLRTTGNYIVAGILTIVIIFLFYWVINKIDTSILSLGKAAKVIKPIAEFIVACICAIPLIRDIKKAILYFRNTV